MRLRDCRIRSIVHAVDAPTVGLRCFLHCQPCSPLYRLHQRLDCVNAYTSPRQLQLIPGGPLFRLLDCCHDQSTGSFNHKSVAVIEHQSNRVLLLLYSSSRLSTVSTTTNHVVLGILPDTVDYPLPHPYKLVHRTPHRALVAASWPAGEHASSQQNIAF